MMVGLSLLKHACDLSDDEVVEWWFDSSYVPEEIASVRVWRMNATKLACGGVVTRQSNLVVVGLAFTGNPYNGDTLAIQLSQVKRVNGKMPEEESVNLGYHGRRVFDSQVFISGQNRRVNAKLICAGYNMRIILMKKKILCTDLWKRSASCNGRKNYIVPLFQEMLSICMKISQNKFIQAW